MSLFSSPDQLDADEIQRLEKVLIDCAEGNEDADTVGLSHWDIEFIMSLEERYQQYGDSIRMTEKQWEQFERIEKKLY